MRILVSALLLSCAWAAVADGQTVRRAGRGNPRLDARLDQVLAGSQRVIARDTFIARNDTLHGPVLSLGNRIVIEGTILGNLTVVDANVYVRPTARIHGNVLNVGSGLYRSEQATIAGRVEDHALAPYHVEREGDQLVIVGDVEYRAFKLDPAIPTAERVNGIRPRLGLGLTLPPLGRATIELYGWGAYGFARSGGWREKLEGGAEVRVRHGFNHLAIGGEETTATNDRWIRSDLKNTLSYLWQGKDYRNYFDADRRYVTVARELVRGAHAAIASVGLQKEVAEPLPARSTWSVFKPDSVRSNPVVIGKVNSATVGLKGEWTGLTAVLRYDGGVEFAPRSLDNGTPFNAYSLWTEVALQGLANHTLEIESRFQGPLLGTSVLPRQRWGMLGGSGTLYTFQIGEFYGDRLVYVESEYSIPIDRVRLPVLGSPALELLHAIGMAWSRGADRSFEQNVGVRLQFPIVFARFVTNPADLDDSKFSVGVSLPAAPYPWQKAQRVENPLQGR